MSTNANPTAPVPAAPVPAASPAGLTPVPGAAPVPGGSPPGSTPSRLRQLLIREVRRFLSRLEADEVDCTPIEAMRVIEALSHEALSKEEALIHLGYSRSRFDDYVHRGLLPKGRKRQGFKELVWYRDELNAARIKIANRGLS